MSTFPRTPGRPLVSVLIPSRGRPKYLCQSVDSIYSLARDKSSVEFIFKVDEDDKATISQVESIGKLIPIKKIISPRGNGYADMHKWVNEMSKMATGDWLFNFNDDAVIATQDWDQILLDVEISSPWHGVADIAALPIPTVDNPHAEEFIFLRRKVVEVLGYYSLIPHVDTWIKTLMKMVNSNFFLEYISAHHFVRQINDKVRTDGVGAKETTEYTINGHEYNIKKLEDALKLERYIHERVKEPKKYEITDIDTEVFLSVFNEPIKIGQPPEKLRILEVGSHDEPVANILSDNGYSVTGIDLREYNPMQDLPGKKPSLKCNYEYIRGDFCELSKMFLKERPLYDTIISLSAIEHFGLGTYGEEPHPYYDIIAMKCIWDLLKDNGTAYISVPYGSTFIQLIPHWRVYNSEALKERIIQDFTVENMKCFVADDAVINGKLRHKKEALTWEEANSYSGKPPHISVLMKLRKIPINRKVKDGR